MALRDILEKTNDSLDRVLMVITGLALIFSTLLTFIGVILRYIFGISFEWNEELCRYSMIIIVYFWAGSMMQKRQHIYFGLFSDRLQGRGDKLHRLLISVMTAALGIPLISWGVELTASAYEAELRTLSLLFPLWPAYAIIPAGVTLIVIQAFFEIFRLTPFLLFRPKASRS